MVDQTAEEPLVDVGPERNPVEDHIALIYEQDEERLTTITPLIKVGLEKGELCLYVSNEEDDQAIVEALKAENIDVDKAVSNGSLILTSKKEMYFKLGRFDPEWTIRVINNIADLARSYGFTAMRVMSDMAWTQDNVSGVERWPEYEAKMNTLNPGISLRIICQYDRRLFAADALMAAVQTHPRIAAQGEISRNSFFIPSERLLKGDYAEAELERVMSRRHSPRMYQVLNSVRASALAALAGSVRLTPPKGDGSYSAHSSLGFSASARESSVPLVIASSISAPNRFLPSGERLGLRYGCSPASSALNSSSIHRRVSPSSSSYRIALPHRRRQYRRLPLLDAH